MNSRKKRGGFTLVELVIVMAVIVVSIGLVARCMDNAGILGDRRSAVTMRVIMMLDGVAARVARMRTEHGDQPRQKRADQRQKDDCLDHLNAFLRMISGQTKAFVRENRFTLFRIMR